MDKLELIHEFLDGSLSAAEEEQLFATLSTDYELRTELKQQMAIGSAIKSDMKAFTPKAESTMNIFNTLGFAAPVAAPAPTFLSRLRDFYAGNSSAILTGILSAVGTALIFFLLWETGLKNNGRQYAQNEKQEQTIVNYELPVVESYVPVDELNYYKEAQPTEKIVYRNVYIEKEDKNNDNQIANSNLALPIEPVATYNGYTRNNIIGFDKYNSINNSSSIAGNAYNPLINDINKSKQNSFTDNFRFELSGAQYFNSIQGNMQPSEQMVLNNTNLSILYEINNELYFGFSYTRENFYQKFRGYEFGTLYEYEQNPNLNTFSAMLRYTPDWLNFNIFRPYINLSGGANNIGPVVRGGIGTTVEFGYGSYLFFGVDGSIMWYEHQRAINNSQKLGIHGGFGLRL